MRPGFSLSVLGSAPFFGVALFAFSAGFPPFDDATEVDLTLHMLQHVLIIVSGVIIAYPLFKKRLVSAGREGLRPKAGLVGAALLIVFWHFPAAWDAAVLNPWVHFVEHFSFLAVGVLAGSWLLLLSDSTKIGALMAAFFGHMGYAVALISPWHIQVYALYALGNQMILGWVLLLTGPSLVVGEAYLIARNPDWLGGFSGPNATRERRQTFVNRLRLPVWLAPVFSGVLIIVLAGYFVTVAAAVSASNPGNGNGSSVVYIVETPVSWQYSPQSVTVVLGLNSTVVWVSHSLSYDTVTDRAGSFASGPIAPGQTFKLTFTRAGVYSYYCLYHPWMTGTVTVMTGDA